MSKAPRPPSKATKARSTILSNAAQMMRTSGYDAMSLRDLAERVGMQAGSLYYHFPSKDALALEVMRLGVEIVAEGVAKALARAFDANPRERLLLAMRIHLETLLSASDFTSAHIRCYPYVPSDVREKLTTIRQAYDRVWDELINDLLGPETHLSEVRQMRQMILGAMNWSLEWFDPKRDDVDSYVATLEKCLPQI